MSPKNATHDRRNKKRRYSTDRRQESQKSDTRLYRSDMSELDLFMIQERRRSERERIFEVRRQRRLYWQILGACIALIVFFLIIALRQVL